MDLARLAKATILNTHTGERVQVMYNPEQYSLDQGNTFAEIGIPGLPASPIQYVRGRARVVSMELFFDSYERGEDVRRYSGQIVRLLDKLPRTQAPPILLFTMGQFCFKCVLVDANQRYTMFTRDGTPVRATLSVKLQEFVEIEVQVERGLFIGPPTVHAMIERQTVSDLATEYLGDPGAWRTIAEANNLDDPFNVPAGQLLVIPASSRP